MVNIGDLSLYLRFHGSKAGGKILEELLDEVPLVSIVPREAVTQFQAGLDLRSLNLNGSDVEPS